MKLNKIVNLLFGLFIILVLQSQVVPDCDNPKKLRFDQDTIYFDTLIDGEVLPMTFHFTNTSCDTIKIKQVYTGCSCTSPSYNDGFIAPGEKDSIPIIFKSKGWGSKNGNLVDKHVYVIYNGGSQVFFFTGIVIKENKPR